MGSPSSIIAQSLPIGSQPNQGGAGCCAECYSNTLGVSKEQNPVPIDTEIVQLALPNSSRKRMIIVNTGSTTIYIGYNSGVNASSYVYALPAVISSPNDGTGGLAIDEMWQGSVFAVSSSSGGSVNFTELV